MKQYIVDSFTNEPFAGNPAAVCVMDSWPSEGSMMKLAMENNLSETAFIVKEEKEYHLRWFTPGTEVELCGHATLASAYVILNFYEQDKTEVTFSTLSGKLIVKQNENLYEMDFPTYELKEVPVTDDMEKAFGARPLRRAIQSKIEDRLANELLEGKIKRGDQVQVQYRNKEIRFIVKDKKDTWDIYAIFYETDEKTKTLDATNRFDHPNLISIARIDEKDRKETDEWTEFYLPFVTKTGKTVDKDKLKAGKYNVAIVFSSSIEGDYFRGAVGSTLHIDEVELIHAAD